MSAKKRSESEETTHARRPRKQPSDKTARKQDLGRALRTIYDDTLREAVPNDFLDLIGKLS